MIASERNNPEGKRSQREREHREHREHRETEAEAERGAERESVAACGS